MRYVFSLADARGLNLGAPGGPRTMYLLLEPATTGSNALAMGVEDFPPGGHTPDGVHPSSDEVFFVISGSGEAIVAGEKQTIGPGDAVWIPRGVRHQIRNPGPGVLRTTWIFVPAGPEATLGKSE